jgi:phage tail-like protein
MPRNDPLRNFRYVLVIDDIAQAGFSEVTIPDSSTDAVDYREGNHPAHVQKLSGLTKYGNVTLKWGLTTTGNALQLYQWYRAISDGFVRNQRKTVAIEVQDESGRPAARFVISDAWPIKYDPSDLNAKGNEVIIETLELVNEGIRREA